MTREPSKTDRPHLDHRRARRIVKDMLADGELAESYYRMNVGDQFTVEFEGKLRTYEIVGIATP